MSLEGWIFMVGLRVFDVGGLIVWLVWFFKLREEDDDADDDGPGGSGPPEPDMPPPDPGGPGGRGRPRPDLPPPARGGLPLPIPLPDAAPWPHRRRDHGGDRDPAPA